MHARRTAFAIALAVLTACAGGPQTPAAPPADRAAPAIVVTVREQFVSEPSREDELDSVASWTAEDGRTLVVATAKTTHRLVVFDGDSGERLRSVGSRGRAQGQFDRPNGIAIRADLAFVAERDNHRIQVLSLPGLRPVGSFGEAELRSPYGLWLNPVGPDGLDVYVTDSFMYGDRHDVVPPAAELSQRVRRYRLRMDGDGMPRVRYLGSFGDTSEAASLHIVESIAGDPDNDRLMIADEDQRRPSTLREYTLAGRYTGRSLPQDVFAAQAEGVALWGCPDGAGYWIAVDQLSPLTVFHLFDRVTLAPRGSFRGVVTAHTDGVAVNASATPRFPAGALYAVHDDRALVAFDLRDVADALGLDRRCTH